MGGIALNQLIVEVKSKDKELDMEWVYLMIKAKEAGLTTNEIRSFLKGFRQSE